MNFLAFCKQQWKGHPQSIIKFEIWMDKYMDELTEAWIAETTGTF